MGLLPNPQPQGPPFRFGGAWGVGGGGDDAAGEAEPGRCPRRACGVGVPAMCAWGWRLRARGVGVPALHVRSVPREVRGDGVPIVHVRSLPPRPECVGSLPSLCRGGRCPRGSVPAAPGCSRGSPKARLALGWGRHLWCRQVNAWGMLGVSLWLGGGGWRSSGATGPGVWGLSGGWLGTCARDPALPHGDPLPGQGPSQGWMPLLCPAAACPCPDPCRLSVGCVVPLGWPVAVPAARSSTMGLVSLRAALKDPASTVSLPLGSCVLPGPTQSQGRPRPWGTGREWRHLSEIPRERRHECLLAARHCCTGRGGFGGAMCRMGRGRAALRVWVVCRG